MKIITREYFTLKDALERLTLWDGYDFSSNSENLRKLVEEVLGIVAPASITAAESEELWSNYLVPTYYNAVIFSAPENDENFESHCEMWVRRLITFFNRTYSKYAILIQNYKAQELKLMDTVKAKGVNKVNALPQLADVVAGTDMSYVNDLSTTESESQTATVAVRLAEIRQVWENVYDEWMGEFKKLFYVLPIEE